MKNGPETSQQIFWWIKHVISVGICWECLAKGVVLFFWVQSIKPLEPLLEEIYQGDLEMPLLRRSRTLEMKSRNESEPQGTDRIQKQETKRVRQSYC